MIVYRAAWVLPIASPPIKNGWVAVDRGRIVAVGGSADEPPGDSGAQPAFLSAPGAPPPGALRSLRSRAPFGLAASLRDAVWFDGAHVAILPALVNAHTHLELSWMRGRVPPAVSMPEWVARLIALRRETPPNHETAIAAAIDEARACGTSLIGDVTNSLASYDHLANSPLSACVFHELFGFNAADPVGMVAAAQRRIAELTPIAWLRPSIVAHAPYSVSVDLLAAIAGASSDTVMSIHIGESPDEVRFLRHGDGAWCALLAELGAWNPQWAPPRCGPVEYLDRFGLVSDRLLAVHAVQLEDRELERLAAAGATVVTCPRSNKWTGVGAPPIERFYASGVAVAIGTDSLASADDLNMFSELRAVRAVARGVPASQLLQSATRSGAVALGFGDELGTIEPGKRAELIVVQIPEDVTDVEEYLVGGIEPDQIRWLDPD